MGSSNKGDRVVKAMDFRERDIAGIDVMPGMAAPNQNNDVASGLDGAAQPGSNPSVPNKAYDKQKKDWEVIDNVLGGTRRMRELNETADSNSIYILKKKREKSDAYERRILISIMKQFFGDALDEFTGLAFMKEPSLKSENKELVDFTKDVTKEGDDLGTFSRQFFRKVTRYGHSYILVDAPAPVGEIENLEQYRALDASAYMLAVKATDVISWFTTKSAGGNKLTLAVIKETVIERVGDFGEKEIQQYRVLTIGTNFIFRKNKDGKFLPIDKKGFSTGLDYIPLFAAYSDPEHGFFTSTPPLIELAYGQIKDYQLLSDYDRGTEIVAFPTMVMSGLSDEEAQSVSAAVGPTRGVAVSVDGKIYFAEITGKGAELLQWRIDENKKHLGEVALSFNLKNSSVVKTATGEMMESKLQGSKMVFTIKSCENTVNQAYGAVVDINKWEIDKENDRIQFFKDFNNVPNPQAAEQRLKLFLYGAIDWPTLIRGSIKDEIISEDTDIIEMEKNLDIEPSGDDVPVVE